MATLAVLADCRSKSLLASDIIGFFEGVEGASPVKRKRFAMRRTRESA
jgi:hypothetical protein